MKKIVMMLAVLTLVSASGIANAAPDVAVLPADIRGVVLFPDGSTPADGLTIRVWNTETEEIVFKTKTNKQGIFDLPRLDPGDHYVTAGPVRIDMRVLDGRPGTVPQPHGFVVVIPKRAPVIQPLIPTTITASATPFLAEAPTPEPRIVSP
jgi:hypothetical protein